MRIVFILCCIAGLCLACGSASAQKSRSSAGAAQRLDSVSLRYKFKAGDKVTYRVISYDSIMIYDTTWRTLARERAEQITFRCDSVVDSGYIMTVNTTDYAATERLDTLPPITRTTHDWIDRNTTYLMSFSGRRIQFLSGVNRPGNAPGGPFEPLLLPYLGDAVGWIGQSGAFDNNGWLVDNIYPPIQWKGTDFRVVPERKDTLGGKVVHVGISEVATTAYQVPGSKDNPITKATINGGGDYYFSPKLGVMMGGSYDMIARFTLELPGGRQVEGRHVMSMYYHRVKENGR